MANLKSSLKDIRRTKRRTFLNNGYRTNVDKMTKAYNKNPDQKSLSELFSIIDKMAKKNIYHKNKAAREKSRLSKILLKGSMSEDFKVVKSKIRKVDNQNSKSSISKNLGSKDLTPKNLNSKVIKTKK
jgi:small subunit ribosomal protein S20